MVPLSSEFLDLVTETFTLMTIRQIEKLCKFVDFLEVRQSSNWHKEYVVILIVGPRDCHRNSGLWVGDIYPRLAHGILRVGGQADVGGQGVVLAVLVLLLLHVAEGTRANPDLGILPS